VFFWHALYLPSIPPADAAGVEIVGLIWPHLRAAEAQFDDVFDDLFKRHAVLFVHRKEEKRHHDHDHDDRRGADADARFEQKENRHTHKCAERKADQLSFGQIEQDFRFDFC
jgi:hypothetical protein